VTAVVLGCDIWCATVGQDHRLECLRIGCEGDIWVKVVRGDNGWRRMRKEKIDDLYCSPDIIRVIKNMENEMV